MCACVSLCVCVQQSIWLCSSSGFYLIRLHCLYSRKALQLAAERERKSALTFQLVFSQRLPKNALKRLGSVASSLCVHCTVYTPPSAPPYPPKKESDIPHHYTVHPFCCVLPSRFYSKQAPIERRTANEHPVPLTEIGWCIGVGRSLTHQIATSWLILPSGDYPAVSAHCLSARYRYSLWRAAAARIFSTYPHTHRNNCTHARDTLVAYKCASFNSSTRKHFPEVSHLPAASGPGLFSLLELRFLQAPVRAQTARTKRTFSFYISTLLLPIKYIEIVCIKSHIWRMFGPFRLSLRWYFCWWWFLCWLFVCSCVHLGAYVFVAFLWFALFAFYQSVLGISVQHFSTDNGLFGVALASFLHINVQKLRMIPYITFALCILCSNTYCRSSERKAEKSTAFPNANERIYCIQYVAEQSICNVCYAYAHHSHIVHPANHHLSAIKYTTHYNTIRSGDNECQWTHKWPTWAKLIQCETIDFHIFTADWALLAHSNCITYCL